LEKALDSMTSTNQRLSIKILESPDLLIRKETITALLKALAVVYVI
jgi:hypothetical protein